MKPGELYLANFPFGGSAGMKLRPVLLLTAPVGPVPEVLVAYISSVVPQVALPSDLLVDPANPIHASTGLRCVSVIRLHKLATLHSRTIMRRLGKLSLADSTAVADRLRKLLNV